MKNLFKNLMLVAVAAMAFTACQNDNNEVNEVAKKTVISGVLNIENEDTRSGFTGSYTEGDKTFYQSKWDGGETIKIYIDGCGSVFTQVDEEGRFEVVVDGEIPSGTAMYVCSPADAWDSQWTPTIPTEQTPCANSVDPAAHILQSLGATVASSMITMSPQQACYGKMTVNAPDFEIAKVEVSFNGGKVYTINAKNVENNVFWFAVDSEINVSTFTVTAYDAEDNAITKTVDVAAAGKTLKFQWGRVSTFSVSGLEVPTVPEEPEETYDYTTAYVSNTWNDTDKLITFTAEGKEDLNVNFVDRSFDGNSIAAGTYYYGDGVYDEGITLGYYWGSSVVGVSSLGSVVVSVVDGCYLMQFNGLKLTNGSVIERLTFKGTITGLEIPDPRTTLALPSNVTISVSGKTITLKWDAVVGADGYKVKMWNPHDEAKEEIVYETQYVFEAQKSNTKYYFNLYSYAKDDNAEYKSSYDWVAKEITTEDTDPKMEVSESQLAFSADGGEKTFNVTLMNTDAEITYTQEGDWFSVEMSGNTFTVTAEANESETDARNGSITVAAGELSQTITLTQSMKPAASTGDADGTSIAKAYTFTSYSTYKDFGYPVMCLSGAENGATFNFESNNSNGFPTGMHKFNDGAWYSALCEYKINGEAQTVDFVNSVIWVEGDNVNGYTVEYIYIVTEGGNGIYYKYDGKFFM